MSILKYNRDTFSFQIQNTNLEMKFNKVQNIFEFCELKLNICYIHPNVHDLKHVKVKITYLSKKK